MTRRVVAVGRLSPALESTDARELREALGAPPPSAAYVARLHSLERDGTVLYVMHRAETPQRALDGLREP